MLTNKQIASKFDLLAKLMELHDENPFKIKSYANAYLSLRKLEGDLISMPKAELASIKGIGNSIAQQIEELITSGQLTALQRLLDKTPTGVIEMLSIKGLGPKKVKQIWQEMSIDNPGELLYACNENRLLSFKGFGIKVQEEVKNSITYFIESKGKYLYNQVYLQAEELCNSLKQQYAGYQFLISGDVRRLMPEVSGIEIISDFELVADNNTIPHLIYKEDTKQWFFKEIPCVFPSIPSAEINKAYFIRSSSPTFAAAFDQDEISSGTESEILKQKGLPYIYPECREYGLEAIPTPILDGSLIELKDIKGIVHNHSTYSDGLHSLSEMAAYVQKSGFSYFVISDHSKSAGYAGGLSVENVFKQWQEIDQLNLSYGESFRIYKGIESDILVNGSLDYEDNILAQFDVVIASVHSVLQMDEEKATARLIKAIENPYTDILGHPTGRLLLSRSGYPIDHKKIIDACAACGVAIELNANPQRLDIDWTWIPYAMEKNVLISINPDAHSKESIHYVTHGVNVARKGGLSTQMCLNSKSKRSFEEWLRTHKN